MPFRAEAAYTATASGVEGIDRWTHRNAQAELPLDGRIVETRAGTWTVKVRRLVREDCQAVRTAELILIGTPSYGHTLKIPETMLVEDHPRGDIDWILRAIGHWLVYPDPKGANSELIFQTPEEPGRMGSSP